MMRMINRLRVDQNRIGVRGQIRIGGYMSIYNTDLRDEIAVIDEMDVGLDFDDALQSYVAKKLNLEIISFDRHFDGVEGLTRLRPKDVLSSTRS
jgi:predicted nucleic acid-binding protein